MFGSTGGRRSTSLAASGEPTGLAVVVILGIGTKGFSRLSGAGGRCSAVAIASAVGLFATLGIGVGVSDRASVSGGVADSGLGGGNSIGCTAAGAGRGVAGGVAAVFVAGDAVEVVIRQTIG